ncbi:MAG TPA: nitroreductase [Actinophytocola sp.]|uniref:nitroreductase n=1 Tax=Actinophytocola sp. TaxID=1872138 RepID=UPI002DDCDD9C|nr:nitroreductase [Actinophytocola sp.]HEV2783889.1 nitroreductase [Actinophytocola sp.]
MDAFLWAGFLSVLSARHCKRAFLDKPVPREVLEQVLRAAANAPSTRNGQPWQVAVLSGPRREALAARLCAEFDSGVQPSPDYQNRPVRPDEATERRAREAGAGVLRAKGVERTDAAARRAHLRDNYQFYGAPTEMIFHLPAEAPPGLFLEMGFFLENVMLGLVACGLGSCPQFSVAGYADAIRDELGLGDRLVVCGLAVGYPDESVPVNHFHPRRAELADYVQWHDQSTKE